MRILDLGQLNPANAPTNTAQFKIPRNTLIFLQEAFAEPINAILTSLLNSYPATPDIYILYGCTINPGDTTTSGSGSTLTTAYQISAGAVFWQGEVFLYPGGSVSVLTGFNQVPVFTMQTTYDPGDGIDGDPVTYTDASIHNIHNIRTAAIVSGNSSTNNYMGNFFGAQVVNFAIPNAVTVVGSTSVNVTPVTTGNSTVYTLSTPTSYGSNWQSINLTQANVTMSNGGSVSTVGGTFAYAIIGNTLIGELNFTVEGLSDTKMTATITLPNTFSWNNSVLNSACPGSLYEYPEPNFLNNQYAFNLNTGMNQALILKPNSTSSLVIYSGNPDGYFPNSNGKTVIVRANIVGQVSFP